MAGSVSAWSARSLDRRATSCFGTSRTRSHSGPAATPCAAIRFFARHPADTPRGHGVEIIVTTSEIDALYERAKDLDAVAEALAVRAWGARDFRIADPFGYYIRVTEARDGLMGREHRWSKT
jgi:hypothetical protein